VDPQEVARRLARIREAVRDELAGEEGIAGEVVESVAEPSVASRLHGEPNLSSTDWLEKANELSSAAEVSLRSERPVLGPLIHLLRRLMRPIIEPFVRPLRRQEEFNASLVRHLNELGAGLESRVRRLEEAVEATLEDYHAAQRQRHLALFGLLEQELLALQGLAREEREGRAAALRRLRERIDERTRFVDRRLEDKDREVARLEGEIPRLDQLEQAMAEVLQLRTLLREVLEALPAAPEGSPHEGETAPGAAGRGARSGDSDAAPDAGGAAERPEDGGATRGRAELEAGLVPWSGLRDWMADEDYRAFQRAFRGDDAEIRRRMADHVRRFEAAPGPVADLGCGRGELLDLLHEVGIEGVGVELNGADVEACRARGHTAVQADLFDWLEERPRDSLGGVFAAQVVEHLPPSGWQRLVDLAATRLAPGGLLVLETINPLSLYALVRAYVADPTHVRPVHPELLVFLARRAGFSPVELEWQAPVPDAYRPVLEVEELEIGDEVQLLAWEVKEKLDRVDRLTCAPQEYTLQAIRPASGRAGSPGAATDSARGEDAGTGDPAAGGAAAESAEEGDP